VLEDEEGLRLLNYQHNHIARISNLHGLRSLVFLDLYSNALEEVCALQNQTLSTTKRAVSVVAVHDPLTRLGM
jgi:hypothetical protein